MNLKIAFLALVLLGSTGVQSAASKGDEIQEIDLRAIEGETYYLACSGSAVTTCGILGIWQEENKKPGLQKRPSDGAAAYAKDLKLTI